MQRSRSSQELALSVRAAWALLLLLFVAGLPGRCLGAEKLPPGQIKALQRMAEWGDAGSQFQLGMFCYAGEEVPKNLAEAYMWFVLATSRGHPCGELLRRETELFMTAEELAAGQRRATEEAFPTNRLTVAILGWENQTGDTNAAHWGEAVDFLFRHQLFETKRLRLVGGVRYGLRQLKKKRGDSIPIEEARKVGETIEARQVIWGSYRRAGEQWSVTLRLLKVTGAGEAKEFQAASTNWFELRDQLTARVLKELGVTPTAFESNRMARCEISTAASLEMFARIISDEENKPQLANPEQSIRQALELDPQCAVTHLVWATVLMNQDKYADAEQAVRMALKEAPDSKVAPLLLGQIWRCQKKFDEAEDALKCAAALAPDDPDPLQELGRLYVAQNRLAAAAEQVQKARQLAPHSSAIRAQLAAIHALQSQREQALAELKEAERLAGDEDINTEQNLTLAYCALREAPAAVFHLERLLALARKHSYLTELRKQSEPLLQAMRAMLSVAYLKADAPQAINQDELLEALRQKLTPAEMGLATNPVTGTLAMKKWALELTQGATNDLDKAHKLFTALARRLGSGEGGHRTAAQVFADWNKPSSSFRCQEHAFFYVALARAAGLQANFAAVWQNAAGENVHHACAAVWMTNKVLLADPSMNWFGVPHKKYSLLNDLEALAFYHCQLDDLKHKRIAVKLWPESAPVRFNLAMALMSESHWVEGEREFAEILKREPDGYFANLGKGRLAMHKAEFDAALDFLRAAGKTNGTMAAPHLLMAEILIRRDNLRAARLELRQALRGEINEGDAQQARAQIAAINEKIGND